MAKKKSTENKQTTADTHIDAPATMEPGDAPADTTDPDEIVSSVTPDKAAAAAEGHQTVNAAVKVAEADRPTRDTKNDRIEKYEATRPDGTKVTVERNIETGETSVSES